MKCIDLWTRSNFPIASVSLHTIRLLPFFPCFLFTRPCSRSHITRNSSACWSNITNLQIKLPFSLSMPLNNLSKTSWLTLAVKAGFLCLRRRSAVYWFEWRGWSSVSTNPWNRSSLLYVQQSLCVRVYSPFSQGREKVILPLELKLHQNMEISLFFVTFLRYIDTHLIFFGCSFSCCSAVTPPCLWFQQWEKCTSWQKL